MDPGPTRRAACGETCQRGLHLKKYKSPTTSTSQHTYIMKTKLTTTLAALSVALASFSLANCTTSPRSTTGGWHNMGVGPKDNQPMPDANMPGKR